MDATKDSLAERIRAAAKRQGIGIDALRIKADLGGGTFYRLLKGETPKTFRTIQKLRDAGVEIPASLFRDEAA